MSRTWCNLLLCLVMLLPATGCGALNPASKLYGKWTIDLPATVDVWAGVSGNEVTKQIAKAAAQSIGADATLDFRSDDTALLTGKTWFGAAGEEGTWNVGPTEGELLRIEVRRKPTPDEEKRWKDQPSKRPAPRKFDVKFIDANTIEVTSATWQGKGVIFRRTP